MIQEGLQGEWPSGIAAAVDPFQQGHLIERPPLFYAVDLRGPIWSPGRIVAAELGGEEELGEELIDLDPDHRPPFGIITSQSCEIVEERPQSLQPWVQVAPAYRCDPESKLLERDFIARLDPPSFVGGAWIADLRIEVPLEKSLFIGRTPIEAFRDERGYEDFGNWLGARRGRPALNAVIHEVVTQTLGELKTENKPNRKKVRRFRDNIHKLKLGIEDGGRLDPGSARLYVVTKGGRSDEMKEFFDTWWDRANEVAAGASLDLLQTTWLSVESLEIGLERYEQLIDLRSPL